MIAGAMTRWDELCGGVPPKPPDGGPPPGEDCCKATRKVITTRELRPCPTLEEEAGVPPFHPWGNNCECIWRIEDWNIERGPCNEYPDPPGTKYTVKTVAICFELWPQKGRVHLIGPEYTQKEC